jgi:hypothetical protein
MTNFTKTNLISSGDSVFYRAPNDESAPKFVARFKHRGPVTKAKFLKTLRKHYTVESYFAKMTAGVPPLRVLMNDGLLVFGDNGKFILDGKVI